MKITQLISLLSAGVILGLLVWLGYEYTVFKSLQTRCAQNISNEGATIEITFATGTTQDTLSRFISSLSDVKGIEDVELTTSDQALKNFADRHKDDMFIKESLDALKTNPLPATATVRHPLNYPVPAIIESIKEQAARQSVVLEDTVSFAPERQAVAEIITETPSFWLYAFDDIFKNYQALHFNKASLTECANR